MNLRNWLAAGAAAVCASAPALAAAQGVYTIPGLNGPNPVPAQPYAAVNPNNGNPCYLGVAGCPGADPNGASYTDPEPLTVGTPISAGQGTAIALPTGQQVIATRGIAADCTAAGKLTLLMASGKTLNWTVAVGHQNQPYSITQVTASTATCSLYGLN